MDQRPFLRTFKLAWLLFSFPVPSRLYLFTQKILFLFSCFPY